MATTTSMGDALNPTTSSTPLQAAHRPDADAATATGAGAGITTNDGTAARANTNTETNTGTSTSSKTSTSTSSETNTETSTSTSTSSKTETETETETSTSSETSTNTNTNTIAPAPASSRPDTPSPAPARRAATLMDVAAASGVSYATVSRYLNGNPHVSAKAAERIAAAIEQVRYTPNNAARSLVRQRTQTVAFVVHGQPDSIIADPNISTILLTANQTLGDAGYQLVTLISDSPQAGARIGRLASSGFADGWILNTFHRGDPLFETFARLDIPVAISGVGYGDTSPFPAVDIDNRAACRTLTRHLRDGGHRRIAYLCGPAYLPCSDERFAGFRETMGADYDAALVVRAADWTRHDGREAIIRLLASLAGTGNADGDAPAEFGNADIRRVLNEWRIDALMCGSDALAVGAMQYLMAHGIDVPRDLAVAGFDDSAEATALHPGLTTMRQPLAAFGSTLAAMVLDQIEGRARPRTTLLDTELVVRGSTASVPPCGAGDPPAR